MHTFYINQKAYALLRKTKGFQSDFENGLIIADYAMEDEADKKYKAEGSFLNKHSNAVRICISKQSMADVEQNPIVNEGYGISNMDAVNQRNHLYNIELLHIKYSLLDAGLCFFFLFCIRSFQRSTQYPH